LRLQKQRLQGQDQDQGLQDQGRGHKWQG